MKRSKPKPRKRGVFTIFISHIHEEAAVARELRDWFHAAFPGFVKAFVSSDYEDNPLGTRWLQKINRAMTRSRLLITVLSPQSWERMWIHLEAGWALGRGIDILPLCHSGMSVERLPRPYSDYSGTEVERDDFARRLLVALKVHLRLAHSLPPGMLGGLTADVRNACAQLPSTIKVSSTTKHGIRDVTEEIVDMNYPVRSGMQARLEADGYSLSWVRRERVHGLVDIEGYEEVVEADKQGRSASFRTTDGMVLLKRQLTAKAS
jgi:hypothetical protein